MPNIITHIDQLDPNGTYTYADYLMWQFQERLELIKGHIFKMAAPTANHQRISTRIVRELAAYLRHKKCEVFAAPFDVRLIDFQKSTTDCEIRTVVQPDICIVCDRNKLDRRGCLGAPDLIIEILSHSTAKKDLKDKYALYEENQVKEYWIVDYNTTQVFDLNKAGKYQLRKIYSPDDEVPVGIFSDCIINLTDIFEDLDDY